MTDKQYEIQTILGVVPSKSNSYQVIKMGHRYGIGKSKAVKEYERKFFMQCNHYRNKNIEGYFELHLKVFCKNERGDLDNSFKCILDSLQACKAFPNDNKCTKIVAEKYLDPKEPRIEFYLKPAL